MELSWLKLPISSVLIRVAVREISIFIYIESSSPLMAV